MRRAKKFRLVYRRSLDGAIFESAALAAVPPFGELDDDDLHERDGEEDDPGGTVPMNINEDHPEKPRGSPYGIQRTQHGRNAARCDCRAHNVIHRNEEQQKEGRPPNAAEHAEGEIGHNNQSPKGKLQPLLSSLGIEVIGRYPEGIVAREDVLCRPPDPTC